MVIEIRKATIKDVPEIDKIYVEGSSDESKYQYSGNYLKKIKSDLKKYENSRKKGFRKNIKNKKYYYIVIEDNKKIIGFGQAWIKNKETGVAESVYIYKKYRGKGFGTKILKELIKWFKNKKVKYIESSALIKNKPSIKFQQKLDFKPFLIRFRKRLK